MTQRVLYIDPFLPLHDRNSGSLRLFRTLEIMKAEGYDVTFMPHMVMEGHEGYATDVARLGISLLVPPNGTHDSQSVADALAGKRFDTIIISFYTLARTYMAHLRAHCPNARVIVDTIDLHYLREQRQAQISGAPEMIARAVQTHTDEIATYRDADALIAISDIERQQLLAELPEKPVFVVPNVHEVNADGPSFEERNGLVFVGNFWHPPNGEGIEWFCREVMPRVTERLPSVTLDIIGQDPPTVLSSFASPNIRIRGWVPALMPFLDSARVSIAPLLHGAGLKGKVGEALSAGLPVVATSVGAEGLGIVHGNHAMVADAAEDFAAAIVEVHSSPELWQRLSTNGASLIRGSFTATAARSAINAVLARPAAVYFGVPDWNDVARISSVISWYIERHTGDTNSTLHLGVLGIDVNAAFTLLSTCIASLGHDPANIPDVSLDVITGRDFNFVPSTATWITMRNDIPTPSHLRTLATL